MASAMDINMEICMDTMKQTENDNWWKQREGRITASNFGRIMSARNEQSLKKVYESLGGKENRFWTPPACRMGISQEENAKKAYISHKMEVNNVIVSVQDVGLCVPNWDSTIGASPDGIVHISDQLIPRVLEIKCIYDTSGTPKTIMEIAKLRGSSFYCKVDMNGGLQLRKSHKYYAQVIGEMAATGLMQADFVIFHPRTGEIKVIPVAFDQDFWKKLQAKLNYFSQKYLKTDKKPI